MSPAQLIFGRALVDFLPDNPKAYQLHPYWSEELKKRQVRRTTLNDNLTKRYNIGTRNLKPLKVGEQVIVQHHANKRWNRSAVIVKVLPHRAYQIRMDDTGNLTYRNRRFLKRKNKGIHLQQTTCCYAPDASVPQIPYSGFDNSDTDSVVSFDVPPMEEEERRNALTTNTQSSPTDTQSSSTDTQSSQNPNPPRREKMAIELRRLLPHNNPGLKETESSG